MDRLVGERRAPNLATCLVVAIRLMLFSVIVPRFGRLEIPFNQPYIAVNERQYLDEVLRSRHLSGHGEFTARCERWLEAWSGSARALLTTSCTAALELATLLCDIRPGDEVVMPSFTFPSTANAVVLRGGTPVFVDIEPETMNIDPVPLENALTHKTKAIIAVHYAGVPADMEAICEIARRHNLYVIEDAAQALLSSRDDRPAGSFGDLSAFSFHDSKNVICGEGGALLVNCPSLVGRAEILWEKGTDRVQFHRGKTDRYQWVDLGSSFLPSEVIAAILASQLEEAEAITASRLETWDRYRDGLSHLGDRLELPCIPEGVRHNGHIFHIRMADARRTILPALNGRGVRALFHYVPLHSSPAGRKFGRVAGALTQTDLASDSVVRLPIWNFMPEETTDRVIETVEAVV